MTIDEVIQPVKHGYWKEEEPRVLKCSVCGEYAPMNYLGQNCIDSRYCPWCGTKMDSNAEEYEAHRYDGIGEFYERECKIEDAMDDAIIKACELAEIVFASEGEDGLYKYRMTKEIPSALHEFAWRFRAELEDLGYEITERQQTTNH